MSWNLVIYRVPLFIPLVDIDSMDPRLENSGAQAPPNKNAILKQCILLLLLETFKIVF